MGNRLEMEDVPPAKPVAGYIGGKRNLAERIIDRIDAIEHDLYAEPFVGMGGVFLRRRRKPRSEVINDLFGDVVTLFRILQRHYPQFMETLRFQLTSRREFERLARTDPATLTDLERAARFLYLQRTTFGGKVAGRSFGVDSKASARFNLTQIAPVLEAVHERLAGVVIECLPWDGFIARYDRAGALFYIDPPYWGSEDDYGKGMFEPADFERLAVALRDLRGQFLLSINDTPETRALFAAFALEPVETTYSIMGGTGMKAGELIVTGGST